jgi:EAL domain-containing protein (putative c-di-GMP-specific phosphodiesterase class I)
VNLSARQFREPTLIDDIERALATSGLNPAYLKLEITESMVMEDGESAIATLEKMKSTGIELAIDDFGTGYSSLSYLRRFPVDVLKIDRSFVERLGEEQEDEVIVSAIVGLGHALRLQVVAEGIETPEQLAKLHELGCDLGQGYHFSRPLAQDALETLLTKRNDHAARVRLLPVSASAMQVSAGG